MQQYQYQVRLVGAAHPVTILSAIPTLDQQWQHMRRNDVHMLFSRAPIMMNYMHIVCMTGPNKPFDSMHPNPFPEGR